MHREISSLACDRLGGDHLPLPECSMTHSTARRPPDPVLISRLRNLVIRAGSALPVPTTTLWVGRALARVDGGPIADPRQLGPALRACGFHRSFRREGARRTWGGYPPAVRPVRVRKRAVESAARFEGAAPRTATGCRAITGIGRAAHG